MKLALTQAAQRCGVHPDTLKGWSLQDPPVGPPFTRTEGGHRRYDEDELAKWVTRHRFDRGAKVTA